MNKHELIRQVSSHTGITYEATALIVDTLISKIKETVEQGEIVRINEFCTIKLAHFKNTVRYNVKASVNIQVPASKVPRFYTSKKWKLKINEKEQKKSQSD